MTLDHPPLPPSALDHRYTRFLPNLRLARLKAFSTPLHRLSSSFLLLLFALSLPSISFVSALLDTGDPAQREFLGSGPSTKGSLVLHPDHRISLPHGCRRSSDFFGKVCQDPFSTNPAQTYLDGGMGNAERDASVPRIREDLIICQLPSPEPLIKHGSIKSQSAEPGQPKARSEKTFAISGTIMVPDVVVPFVQQVGEDPRRSDHPLPDNLAPASSSSSAKQDPSYPGPADEGFWRQRNGEQEWVPSDPDHFSSVAEPEPEPLVSLEALPRAKLTDAPQADAHSASTPSPTSLASATSSSEGSQDDRAYDAWTASAASQEGAPFLSFNEWKEQFYAAERDKAEQERQRAKLRKGEKLKSQTVAGKDDADKLPKRESGSVASENGRIDSGQNTQAQTVLPTGKAENLSHLSVIGEAGEPTGTSPSLESLRSKVSSDSSASAAADQPVGKASTELGGSTGDSMPSIVELPVESPKTEPVLVNPAAEKGTRADPEVPDGVSVPSIFNSYPAVADASSLLKTLKHRWNFASYDCAAVVHRSNPSAKFASSILNEKKDRYMLSPCPTTSSGKEGQFVIVELCDEIKIDTIVLANYEFFSRMFKRFSVRVANDLQRKEEDWVELGTFRARNMRGLQVFNVPTPREGTRFFRYVRIDILEHYGSEYFCPISLLRVYGLTQLEDFEREEEEERKLREKRERELLQAFESEAEALYLDGESASWDWKDDREGGENIPGKDNDDISLQNEKAAAGGIFPFDAAGQGDRPLQAGQGQNEDPRDTNESSGSGVINTVRVEDATSENGHGEDQQDPSQGEQGESAPRDQAHIIEGKPDHLVDTQGQSEGFSVQLQVPGFDGLPHVVSANSTASDRGVNSTTQLTLEHSSNANASVSASASNPIGSHPLAQTEESPGSSSLSSETLPKASASGGADQAGPEVSVKVGAATSSGASDPGAQLSSHSHSIVPPSASSVVSTVPVTSTALPAPASPLPPPPPSSDGARAPQAHSSSSGGGSESIYRAITRRLNALEANATLSLHYMEHSGQMLREIFQRMEKRQEDRMGDMLRALNASNWRQIEALKRRSQVDLQRAIFEFDVHRQQAEKERQSLLAEVNLLAEEVILEKRLGIAQLVLLLSLLVFMGLTRGSRAAPLLNSGLAKIRRKANSGRADRMQPSPRSRDERAGREEAQGGASKSLEKQPSHKRSASTTSTILKAQVASPKVAPPELRSLDAALSKMSTKRPSHPLTLKPVRSSGLASAGLQRPVRLGGLMGIGSPSARLLTPRVGGSFDQRQGQRLRRLSSASMNAIQEQIFGPDSKLTKAQQRQIVSESILASITGGLRRVNDKAFNKSMTPLPSRSHSELSRPTNEPAKDRSLSNRSGGKNVGRPLLPSESMSNSRPSSTRNWQERQGVQSAGSRSLDGLGISSSKDDKGHTSIFSTGRNTDRSRGNRTFSASSSSPTRSPHAPKHDSPRPRNPTQIPGLSKANKRDASNDSLNSAFATTPSKSEFDVSEYHEGLSSDWTERSEGETWSEDGGAEGDSEAEGLGTDLFGVLQMHTASQFARVNYRSALSPVALGSPTIRSAPPDGGDEQGGFPLGRLSRQRSRTSSPSANGRQGDEATEASADDEGMEDEVERRRTERMESVTPGPNDSATHSSSAGMSSVGMIASDSSRTFKASETARGSRPLLIISTVQESKGRNSSRSGSPSIGTIQGRETSNRYLTLSMEDAEASSSGEVEVEAPPHTGKTIVPSPPPKPKFSSTPERQQGGITSLERQHQPPHRSGPRDDSDTDEGGTWQKVRPGGRRSANNSLFKSKAPLNSFENGSWQGGASEDGHEGEAGSAAGTRRWSSGALLSGPNGGEPSTLGEGNITPPSSQHKRILKRNPNEENRSETTISTRRRPSSSGAGSSGGSNNLLNGLFKRKASERSGPWSSPAPAALGRSEELKVGGERRMRTSSLGSSSLPGGLNGWEAEEGGGGVETPRG
ncbi:hypothetical protein IE53DRAFT_408166 [Violaceomyces palustris]|uniref:Uncharacterized protein n=1 Tax=Violaceomyces palustris TaxID=1673888 RepID=A0ACD0P7T8_9BASI|nr:hypothetical protein IE53DRAFT_408166 [Violaceomyces palustris]